MIACGFDVHRAQITFDLVDHETGSCVAAGSCRRRASSCGCGSPRWRRRGWWWRWRARRAGGSWPRSWRRRARGWCWPSRARRVRCVGRSGERRPTVPMRAGCGSCSSAASCRSPGSRPSTCSSCAAGCGCARRWPTSAAPGCSACTRSCFITAIPVAGELAKPAARDWLRADRALARRPRGRRDGAGDRRLPRHPAGGARRRAASLRSCASGDARARSPLRRR